MNLVLANIDYRGHMTDEGEQLQAGLALAGWTLAGYGYGDGCTDVPTLLARYKPERVFVQDCRDWSTACGAFDPRTEFRRVEALRDCPDVALVLKDAGTAREIQEAMAERIGGTRTVRLVTYYHWRAVEAASMWADPYAQVRTWHSVDRQVADALRYVEKQGAIVTGARNREVYPLRERAYGLDWIERIAHPGYHNRGTTTPAYLRTLSGYRVHIATASRYGFALRKIIESVACGCTPITDLPAWDVLPEIDGALVRVAPDVSAEELAAVVRREVGAYDEQARAEWAEKARAWYDWRAMGLRLSRALGA